MVLCAVQLNLIEILCFLLGVDCGIGFWPRLFPELLQIEQLPKRAFFELLYSYCAADSDFGLSAIGVYEIKSVGQEICKSGIISVAYSNRKKNDNCKSQMYRLLGWHKFGLPPIRFSKKLTDIGTGFEF